MSERDAQDMLVDLQSRLAYQEHTLETLDAAVAEQELRIERLQAAVDRLSRRIEAALGDGPGGEGATGD